MSGFVIFFPELTGFLTVAALIFFNAAFCEAVVLLAIRSATASADNVSFVYAASYYFSDEKQTTDLVRVGNVVMQPLWTRKYNIYTFKLINVRDGGYLLIGKLNSTTEKIIRVNPAGEL